MLIKGLNYNRTSASLFPSSSGSSNERLLGWRLRSIILNLASGSRVINSKPFIPRYKRGAVAENRKLNKENMKTIIKPYLRPFLITGITFGILMVLWDYFDKGNIDLIKLIFMSVCFGALMSWRAVASQKQKNKEKKANH